LIACACSCSSQYRLRYNPPNETLEDFIDRGVSILQVHPIRSAPHIVSGKENRWQMKESLASMQLCTDVDGEHRFISHAKCIALIHSSQILSMPSRLISTLRISTYLSPALVCSILPSPAFALHRLL
jgi:hypothetical protein